MSRFFSDEELIEILNSIEGKIADSSFKTASFIFGMQCLSKDTDLTKKFVMDILKDHINDFPESIKNKILAEHLCSQKKK